MAECRVVNMRKIIVLLTLVIIAIFVLYDVSLPLVVASSYETSAPDPAIEAEYLGCYEAKDAAMHRVAFGTIDNPDVQKEYISTNRERIAQECRKQVPEKMIVVQEPARFNIIDLKPRFW